jgi:hypothetical protein
MGRGRHSLSPRTRQLSAHADTARDTQRDKGGVRHQLQNSCLSCVRAPQMEFCTTDLLETSVTISSQFKLGSSSTVPRASLDVFRLSSIAFSRAQAEVPRSLSPALSATRAPSRAPVAADPTAGSGSASSHASAHLPQGRLECKQGSERV